jgi:hypothetical protein
MTFEVDPVSLNPISCRQYDAYCYTGPPPGVQYIEHAEWTRQRWDKYRREEAMSARHI